MNFNISFADGLQYTLYPADIELLETTGLRELLTKENVYKMVQRISNYKN